MTHVMEQLEVDWKFNVGLQTADNELLARLIDKMRFSGERIWKFPPG